MPSTTPTTHPKKQTEETRHAPSLSQTPAFATSLRWCKRQTSHHARSFYFCSHMLPAEKRNAAFAVYAFCRYADDLVDRAEPGTRPPINQAEEDLGRIIRGETGLQPFGPALAWAFQRFKLDRKPFLELIEGIARDRGAVRIQTWPELRDYCYHVASVVGLIMARLFELRDPEGEQHAVELGIAMQLTNILRDIREDFLMNRIYLPQTELAEFCVTETDLASQAVTSDFTRFMRFQIGRARDYYRHAEKGIRMLPDDGSRLTAWLMRHVYAGILNEIELAGYDVFRKRAATSTATKLRLALRAWKENRRRSG